MHDRSFVSFAELPRHFARSIGLELFNTLLRPRNASEPPKPALQHSRWVALSRCAMQISLLTLFSFLLFLNYRVWYLGPGIWDGVEDAVALAALQVAAKVLEIMCITTLTAVIVQLLRYHLMQEGVPLGLLGSGLYFTSVNYFWSPEMLAGALYCRHGVKKWVLFAAISVSAILALLIGPASAILLQPRVQSVPAGGSNYYLSATPDQLWPNSLDAPEIPSECFNRSATQYLPCPSAGYDALLLHFKDYSVTTQVNVPEYFRKPIPIQISASGQYPVLLNAGSIIGSQKDTFMFQPNAFTALMHQQLSHEWYDIMHTSPGNWDSTSHQYQKAERIVSNGTTTNPIVHVKCSPAQNLSSLQPMVKFPVKLWQTGSNAGSESDEWNSSRAVNASTFGIGLAKGLHAQWMSLPMEFGPVSGGVLLNFPSLEEDSSLVIGCSISASWFQSAISSDSDFNDGAWSIVDDGAWLFPGRLGSVNLTIGRDASADKDHTYGRLINIGEGWFNALNGPLYHPDGAESNDSNSTTTLENFLTRSGYHILTEDMRTKPFKQVMGEKCIEIPFPPEYTDVDRWNDNTCNKGQKGVYLEWMLASLFVDGLSRHASQLVFRPDSLTYREDRLEGDFVDLNKSSSYSTSILSNKPEENPIWPSSADSVFTEQTMKMRVVGYAFYASETSDYLATVVIVIYMLITAIYTAWILIVGTTSSSWDTATELLALALKSPAITDLTGVGAGVERLGTYRRLVSVRAISQTEVDGSEETEELGFVLEKKHHVVEHMPSGPSSKASDTNSKLLSIEQTVSAERPHALRYRRVVADKKYL